jgi:hypothetical protein
MGVLLMKKMIFGIIALALYSSPLWSVPDYKGYNKFLKENNTKIRAMEKTCNDAKGTKSSKTKCNDLMQFRVESECRYGINPNACSALDEIKKMKNKK